MHDAIFTHACGNTRKLSFLSSTNKQARQAACPSSCICTGWINATLRTMTSQPTACLPQCWSALGSWGLHLDAAVLPRRQSPAWERLGCGSSGNNIGRNNELLWGSWELSDQETYGVVTVTDGPKGPVPTTLPQWPRLSPSGLSVPWHWFGMTGWSEEEQKAMQPVKKKATTLFCETLCLSVSCILPSKSNLGPLYFSVSWENWSLTFTSKNVVSVVGVMWIVKIPIIVCALDIVLDLKSGAWVKAKLFLYSLCSLG